LDGCEARSGHLLENDNWQFDNARSLRRISEREPDSKLFEVPEGFTVTSRNLSDLKQATPPQPILPKGGGS
jgi:hypothetical protein